MEFSLDTKIIEPENNNINNAGNFTSWLWWRW